MSISIPTQSVIKHLPILTVVKLARSCLIVAIKKNYLEHVLIDLLEEIDVEDLYRVKPQLDRVEGLARSVINRRIKWGDWPTGPVERSNDDGRTDGTTDTVGVSET